MNSLKITIWKQALLFILFSGITALDAQTVTVGGSNWIANAAPVTEAGNNYSGTLEASTNQILLSTSVSGWFNAAAVSVQYQADPIWHDDLVISVKRTGNGTHTCLLCYLSGGDNYVIVPKVASTQFYIINTNLFPANHNNTPVQIQVSGISVTVPAAAYKARVIFTISSI
ncbi:MAG TPA: hypothetical protein PK191_05905 [Niabella sp.]|mgnify:CR=1 FL=1|nr:hypothetical protein [Niabella sp.]HOZ96306.1 hypothetical protein [Niabella sp.]HQW14620.1 hypothetical protein [Niabella sp.]HQX19759.1 hypothetical protein [Niabella sp.]HQX42750.1 hypothetical protein [Niabella sp.]